MIGPMTAPARTEQPVRHKVGTGLEAMFGWYDRHGLRGNPLTLRAILGREPRTLEAYFGELSAEEGPATTH